MITLLFYTTKKILESGMTDFQPEVNPYSNQKSANTSFGQTALNIILVLAESLLTLLLRFDGQLRQIVYPLAQDNTVLCIRSYMPHVSIYATFTVNGVLLDSKLQHNQQVDVTLNGFTWEVVHAIASQRVSVVENLHFRGEMEKVTQVKAFFLAISVLTFIQEILQKFTGKSQKPSEKPKKSIYEYQQKIESQKQQINELTVKNAEVETALLELKSQNKILKISLGIMIIWCFISLFL